MLPLGRLKSEYEAENLQLGKWRSVRGPSESWRGVEFPGFVLPSSE